MENKTISAGRVQLQRDGTRLILTLANGNVVICKDVETQPLEWGWFPKGEKRNYMTWSSDTPLNQTNFNELHAVETEEFINDLQQVVSPSFNLIKM